MVWKGEVLTFWEMPEAGVSYKSLVNGCKRYVPEKFRAGAAICSLELVWSIGRAALIDEDPTIEAILGANTRAAAIVRMEIYKQRKDDVAKEMECGERPEGDGNRSGRDDLMLLVQQRKVKEDKELKTREKSQSERGHGCGSRTTGRRLKTAEHVH
jgi:hypothetical protein